MITRFDNETVGDWSQRYAGCFGVLHIDGATPLVKLTEVDGDKAEFITENKLEQFVYLKADCYFEFTSLERRWWPTTTGPILSIRVPRRQWKRGISRENCTLFTLWSNRLRAYEPSFENLKEILQPKVTTCKGYLSKHFAFTEDGKLFFFDQLIGQINEKERKILVTQLFFQEVIDVVKKNTAFASYKVEACNA